jgi:hypothetical protein
MILLVALAGAVMPVEAAERAFAAQAQRDGQWTAFRANAAPEAVMFAPEMVRTADLLRDQPDPPRALMWWPARTITSCDGTLAVSTGPWTGPGNGTGTYTTVWRRQVDGGWKWLIDSGRDLPVRQPATEPTLALKASCWRAPPGAHNRVPPDTGRFDAARLATAAAPALRVEEQGRRPSDRPRADLALELGPELVGGASDDATLDWAVQPVIGGAKGAHVLRVWYLDGATMRLVLVNINGTATQ